MREQFLAALPVVGIRRDRCYDVPGCIVRQQCLPRPTGVHLILADPSSKEWGSPQLAFWFRLGRVRIIAVLILLLMLALSQVSVYARPWHDPASFINSVTSPAQGEMQDSGVPASFSIAQASYESNWQNVSTLAATHNNYHGIKCSSPNEGLSCMDLSGSSWNRYSSTSAGFLWHGRWLHGNPRYANAFNFIDDPEEFARQVATAGYCPPPDCNTERYAQIVNQRINDWDMTQYDNQETPFVGAYYDNPNLSGKPVFSGVSEKVDFNWGDGGPQNSYRPSYNVGADDFSIRWKAKQQFSEGRYRFYAVADDGVRLWVGGNLIIDQWRDQASTEWTGDIDMDDGLYWIRMEYYERREVAEVKLSWERVEGDTRDGDTGDRVEEWWEKFLTEIQTRLEQLLEEAQRRFIEWLETQLQEYLDQLCSQLCGTAMLPGGMVLLWWVRRRRRW